MYIAVDFDGTIVDHAYPNIGKPVPGAITWLKRYQELGAKLILFTVRSNDNSLRYLDDAVEYLKSEGIILFGVNKNPVQAHFSSSPKVFANLYIDDAAFGCPCTYIEGFHRACVDWSIVGLEVEKILIGNKGG